jgi:hypothetical protein
MIFLILTLICVFVFYTVLMQVVLVGKANFHPIHGKGVEWLQQELQESETSSYVNCKAISPLQISSVYDRHRFPLLTSYIVNTKNNLSYSVWRFTKADALLRKHIRQHKPSQPMYLKF